ncbi:MAG: glycosyltransferase, partial [Flavobacterium sp.]
MSSINVFYFDSKGFSEAYGIGSYRKMLLPELSKSRLINLIHVRFSYRERGNVQYEKRQMENYSILDITFSYHDLQAHLLDEFYIDKLRSRIIVAIITRVTGLNAGIFHLNSPTDYALALAAEEAGYKVVGTQHLPFTVDNKVDYFSEKNKRLLLEKEEVYLERLSGMICLCEQTRRRLSDIHPMLKSRLIFNGITPVKKKVEFPRSIIKQQFGFGKKDMIFLFAGRLVRLKGVFELIDAFIQFSKNKNNVKLIMAGGGDYDGA